MNLTSYKEVRALKGKKLRDTRHPEHPHLTVTSATNRFVRMNNGGIKIITSIFLESKQQFYEIVEDTQ